MAKCPGSKNTDFEKLKSVIGENAAFAVFNKNNGNPIYQTPQGVHSILYSQLLDIYQDEKDAIRAKANIYTEQYLASNNWLKTGVEPVIDNIDLPPKFSESKVANTSTPPRMRDTDLQQRLIDFLSGLNVTTEFVDEIQVGEWNNIEAMSDLLYKIVKVKKGTDVKNVAREAAYMAYSLLGKKNKIRTDLIHSIENLPDYDRIFTEYSEAFPDYHPSKVKELVVVDFLSDAIMNNYKAPTNSKIHRTPEYWGIKGRSPLIKRFKYLLMKLKFFIQKVTNSSRLSGEEVQDLLDSIANDMLESNYEKFSANLSPKVQQVHYEQTIAKEPRAAEITKYIQGLGGMLTGSLSLRQQGTLYRDFETETLHDLDFSLPKDLVDKEMYDALEIELPTNFFTLTEEEQDEAFRAAKSKSLKKIYDKLEDFSIIKKIKEQYPTARVTNAFGGLKPGEYSVAIDIDGLNVDLFFVNETGEQLGKEGFQSWEAIFIAKILMGREKDLTDFINFIPYSYMEENVGKTPGFRHFSFPGDTRKSNTESVSRAVRDKIEKQDAILRAAMPHIKNIVYDETIPQIARLEAGGETITLNPKRVQNDTLGHEYGHLLIDLMGGMSNSFIQDARKQLVGSEAERRVRRKYADLEGSERFDKEVVATAIGMEVSEIFKEKERAEYQSKTTRFAKWLLGFFRKLKQLTGISRNNARVLAQKLTSGKEIDTSKFDGQPSDYIQEARVELKDLTPVEEIAAIKEFSDKFKLTEDEKFYVAKDNPTVLFDRASTVLGKYNLSITEEEAAGSEVLKEGQVIGTFSHAVAEMFNRGKDGKVADPNVTMDDEAYQQVKAINETLFADYIIAPEVKIVDDNITAAGTADVYAINKYTGERVLFDYKTHKKYNKEGRPAGFKFYTTPFGKNPYSQMDKNAAQLGLYKKMYKNALGIDIRKLFVIPLVIDYDEIAPGKYHIKSVQLGDEFIEGAVQMPPMSQVSTIYANRETETAIKKKAEEEKEGELTTEELEELIEKNKKRQREKLLTNKLNKFREKAIKIVLSDIARTKARKKGGSTEKAGKLLHELLQKEEVTDETAVLKFVFNAITSINEMYARMKTLEEREANGDPNAFSLEELHRWYTLLSAYDILEDISTAIFTHELTAKTSDEASYLEEVKKLMTTAVLQKNAIKDQFKSRGVKILADQLAPYLTLIKEDIIRNARREWLRNNIEKQRNMKKEEWMKEMDDYIADIVKDKGEEIIQDTKSKLIAYMIEAAEGDIGVLERWLVSPINSNDPLVAAMTNKFAIIFHRVRKEAFEFVKELDPIVEELEALHGYTMSTDVREMYDFMLEYDEEGNPTGYIVNKFSGRLINRMNRMFEETKAFPPKIMGKKRAEWFDKNMPLDKGRFYEAFAKFIDEMYDMGDITDNQKEFIHNSYRSNSGYYKPHPFVPDHINSEIVGWIDNNKMDYREPGEQWITPKYKELREILKNPNDPRAKFYNKITTMVKELDKHLPQEARLYGQLPFVLKSGAERRVAGQSMKSILKDKANRSLNVQKEDIGYAGAIAEITDENDIPIDLVPTYYKRENNWDAKDQSFDLATIYSMWHNMAVNYREMSDLQPEVEATKEYLKTRTYATVDENGNRVRKAMDALGDLLLSSENKNSNTLNQFEDYMKSLMYGQSMLKEGKVNLFGYTFDKEKALDLVSTYTAYNLLGFNVMQAITNVTFGELSNILEAYAGSYYSMKGLHKATKAYYSSIIDYTSDIGRRVPRSWLGLMTEEFDPLSDPNQVKFREKTAFAQLMKSSTMFFLSNSGEHYMQIRLMMAMLDKVKAYDKNGKKLGSMLDMYIKYRDENNGKYGLPEEVDLEKSGWSEDERSKFSEKVKFVIAGVHGEYSDTGRMALQRFALGRMALAFRKFVVPGFVKRFQLTEKFNQRGEVFTKGYYIEGGSFLGRLAKELATLQITEAGNMWYSADLRERAAVERMLAEIGFFMLLSGLATLFGNIRGESPDDDESILVQMAHFTALRTASELSFYYSPSSFMSILMSPAASVTMVSNLLQFGYRIFPGAFTGALYEKYQRPGMYTYKVEKDMVKLVPVMKQIYRMFTLEDTIDYMNFKF